MNSNITKIWENCLRFMRDNLSSIEEKEGVSSLDDSFDLLFSKVKPISLVDKNLTLQVPSDFYREYIEENYLTLLSAALKKNIGRGVKLWYSVMENKPSSKRVKPETVEIKGLATQVPKPQEVRNPMFGANVVNPFAVPGIRKVNIDSRLNPNLTFDNFVEGECNKFASTVARTIASRPGATSFNPMFIHGAVGVGKTHLAHAIGLEIKEKFPDKVVLYISTEKFIQQFVSAARAKNKTNFANFYQMIDCWIIDDVQFLSGKKATQDMFFHIFDFLHQNGKQIILTSDKAPADIQDIQARIVSRFKWGLSAEIKSPDYLTRKKIVLNKLHRDGIVLEEELIDYLATEVNSNVRELIGIINSVIAHSMILKSELTIELLKDTIGKIADNQKKIINIAHIQEVVCNYFNIQKDQLLSRTRKRDIAMPRQVAMYFSKELTNSTFSKIGEQMGGKDHSTVMYACDAIKGQIKVDKQMKKIVREIKEKILDA